MVLADDFIDLEHLWTLAPALRAVWHSTADAEEVWTPNIIYHGVVYRIEMFAH